MGILPGAGCCVWVYAACPWQGPPEIFRSVPPLLGKHADGIPGRIIDLLAVAGLLAGTAMTFSVATPLMAGIMKKLFQIEISRTVINLLILFVTFLLYTYSLLHGFRGISMLAKACLHVFWNHFFCAAVLWENGIYY